jgi:hypothetical protein
MFIILFSLVFIGTLSLGLKDGPRRAVSAGWVSAAFLLPFWLQMGVGSLVLDLRTGAVIAVCLALLTQLDRIDYRLSIADFLILGIVLAQAVSQYQANSLRPLTVPEIARKWLFPYLMGRFLLTNTDDIRYAVKGLAYVIVFLSSLAVGECFIQINFINTILGKTFGLLEAGEGYRWGLKRAHVTFNHPIFFGMGLVLLLPWALEASRLARNGEGPRWWRLLPLAMAAALFATVSRGPQIAGIATTAIYYFFRLPKIRIPFILLVVGVGITANTFKEELVDLLAVIAGEKSHQEEGKWIFIQGEEVEYTGTNHRVLLFRVYDEAMQKAGWFGYGTELKGVELEESIAERFSSVDCHYLLFFLQHGYLGLGAFIILSLGTLISCSRVAFKIDRPESSLAAGLFGALLAVAVILVSSWFSADFAGIWLFSAGVASRLLFLKQASPVTSQSVLDSQKAKPIPVKQKPQTGWTPLRPALSQS